MAEVLKRSELVVSLATVAIGALGGPLGPVGVAAAKELVASAQRAWDQTSPQSVLRDRVQVAVEKWAAGESIDSEVVDRGLGWAISYVQAAGAAFEVVAEADFDPAATAAAVIAEARRTDGYWGTETEYVVAEQVLRVTYEALCAGLKAEGGVTVAAVLAPRDALLAIEALRSEPVWVADRGDLIGYLMARIREEWDSSPWRRRDLYRTIIDSLLRGRWSCDRLTSLDLEQCRTILQTWAWNAVSAAQNPSGLGAWPDVLITPTVQNDMLERALDHVAPKQVYPATSRDFPSQVERRFLHRTLLEYSVAEHVAGMGADALGALLPHVWFDPDWEVALPMAIAAHPQRDVLVENLWSFHAASPGRAQRVVNRRLEVVLLQTAAQTTPEDWNPEHAGLVHGLRAALATEELDLMGETAHWSASNPDVVAAILDALPGADPGVVSDLVGVLPALDPTGEDLAQARAAILAAVPRAHPRVGSRLVGVLPALVVTGEERAEVRAAVLAALPGASRWVVPSLVGVLPALVVTGEERAQVRAAVLAAVPRVAPEAVSDLVGALGALDPTGEDRALARAAMLATFARVDPGGLPGLVGALSALAPTGEDRALARAAVLAVLPGADPWVVPGLVGVLSALDPTGEDRALARAVILAAVPRAAPRVVPRLMDVLLALDPTEEDRALAQAAILAALLSAAPEDVPRLAGVLPALVVTGEERTRARAAVLAAVPGAAPSVVSGLVGALSALDPSGDDRVQVRAAVLAALPGASRWVVSGLVGVLSALDPTGEERALARAAILAALPGADPWDVPRLVGPLPALDPTGDERALSRAAILAAVPGAAPSVVSDLVDVLTALDPTGEDRAQVRAAILAVLPGAAPEVVSDLVGALRGLSTGTEWLSLLPLVGEPPVSLRGGWPGAGWQGWCRSPRCSL